MPDRTTREHLPPGTTVEALANQIAEQLDGAPFDVSASALVMNLASVIAGYGPRGRAEAEAQFTALLHSRVAQLVDAGFANETTDT